MTLGGHEAALTAARAAAASPEAAPCGTRSVPLATSGAMARHPQPNDESKSRLLREPTHRGHVARCGHHGREVPRLTVSTPQGARPATQAWWATIAVMSTESLRKVRDHFSEVIDRVEREHERVTVTRNGRPAAVILSPDDLAQLEETLDILGDPEALADIREADAAYGRGDVVRGVEALRALRR